MVAMVSIIVVIIVTASLCITGSRYNYMKRNSADSLQLADGDIVGYNLRSKHRNFEARLHFFSKLESPWVVLLDNDFGVVWC